ncbi:MAG: hypothetical protein K2O18_04535 [Oscillospiraceae bacterium]|nr:hypothetical protein [Oscillospiraceae bacterium]
MNLKDAFRAQNKLTSLINEASYILQDDNNLLKVVTTHLRSKIMPDDQDAVVKSAAPSEYAEQINAVAAFLMLMLSEREKLSAAIYAAKSGLPLDMDSEVGLNRVRQTLAHTFRHMAALRNSEQLIDGGGTGYRFNSDGNQVSYRCDAKQVTTINFDRKKIRAMSTELSRKADETSAQLDQYMVNITVDYELPFEINDNFDVILTDFIEKQSGQ